MRVYWSYKSLPEFQGLPAGERDRIVGRVWSKAFMRWQVWAAVGALGLWVGAAIWLAHLAQRQVRGWGLSMLLDAAPAAAGFVGGVAIVPVLNHLLRPYIRRQLPGHCRGCGYNLTGNASGVYPECGTAVPKPQGATP